MEFIYMLLGIVSKGAGALVAWSNPKKSDLQSSLGRIHPVWMVSGLTLFYAAIFAVLYHAEAGDVSHIIAVTVYVGLLTGYLGVVCTKKERLPEVLERYDDRKKDVRCNE